MLEISAHFAAAGASLVTLIWRLRTDTKRGELEWCVFIEGHLINVMIQLIIGIDKAMR